MSHARSNSESLTNATQAETTQVVIDHHTRIQLEGIDAVVNRLPPAHQPVEKATMTAKGMQSHFVV